MGVMIDFSLRTKPHSRHGQAERLDIITRIRTVILLLAKATVPQQGKDGQLMWPRTLQLDEMNTEREYDLSDQTPKRYK